MITQKQISEWRNNGYVIIDNLFEKDLLKKAVNFMNQKNNLYNLPSPNFGSKNGELEFPTGTILDKLTLHHSIINVVSNLLNTNDVLLTQSDAWSKAKKKNDSKNNQDNCNQRFHMDYGNHTFLHPSEWEDPEVVSIIIYLSDLKDTGGETAVVPKKLNTNHLYKPPYTNMPGQGNYTFYNDSESAENYFKKYYPSIAEFRKELYKNEILVKGKIGSVLFYRLDTWHRGTPVKSKQIRHVMNICYKKKECNWVYNWNKGFAIKNYYRINEEMFTNLTPIQRGVLGIPKPGDKYWTKKKILYLKERYPNINAKPYISKL
tara:strand:+ start:1596 stop:2549 length:954 start_codon:yes stop_codon:yes gene_type:complete